MLHRTPSRRGERRIWRLAVDVRNSSAASPWMHSNSSARRRRIYDVGTTALLTNMPTCPGEPIVAWIVLGRCWPHRGVAVATPHNFGRIGK
ncbi:hypothetical protein EJB05_10258 [Eragrostis curvula]|uniref:Uncharacterized protein n=1 Tax=Eragrostis curvula TaxID=38414 RepID=A0A5J9W730_9POAL|nr:hypothetical protein EJB05_10258 [Eragrostis curvula]